MFWRLTYNYNQFLKSFRKEVISGIFKGMKYVKSSYGSCYMPKILGIYEREISEALINALQNSDLFINVGAAEGYYAVGAGLKFPELKVIAYEEALIARQLLIE